MTLSGRCLDGLSYIARSNGTSLDPPHDQDKLDGASVGLLLGSVLVLYAHVCSLKMMQVDLPKPAAVVTSFFGYRIHSHIQEIYGIKPNLLKRFTCVGNEPPLEKTIIRVSMFDPPIFSPAHLFLGDKTPDRFRADLKRLQVSQCPLLFAQFLLYPGPSHRPRLDKPLTLP